MKYSILFERDVFVGRSSNSLKEIQKQRNDLVSSGEFRDGQLEIFDNNGNKKPNK